MCKSPHEWQGTSFYGPTKSKHATGRATMADGKKVLNFITVCVFRFVELQIFVWISYHCNGYAAYLN